MNDAALTVPASPAHDPPVVDEPALVAGARGRSAQAFEALYRRYVGRVYATCVRLTGSAAAAEDITQEAFVRAWECLPAFRGECAFGSWLHRIAVNAALMRQRSGLRRARWLRDGGDDEIGALAAPSETPDAALDLDRAIAVLPPGAREVFVLYDIEGYRHEEIAELTGLAVGTCKAHLHRARRLLRARLTR